jgi:hypothetical protein
MDSVSLLKLAYKKNNILHKNLKKAYRVIGTGKFLTAYYDEKNDVVIKAFKLSVMKDKKHSLLISDNAEELFYQVFNDIMDDPEQIKLALLEYIFKTNLDWSYYCLNNWQQNRYLPRVYDIIIDPEHFSYIIRCERLFHLNKMNDYRIYDFASELCFNIQSYMRSNIVKEKEQELSVVNSHSFPSLIEHNLLKDLIVDIATKFSQYTLDLHSKNIMCRLDGNQIDIILNDPFY